VYGLVNLNVLACDWPGKRAHQSVLRIGCHPSGPSLYPFIDLIGTSRSAHHNRYGPPRLSFLQDLHTMLAHAVRTDHVCWQMALAIRQRREFEVLTLRATVAAIARQHFGMWREWVSFAIRPSHTCHLYSVFRCYSHPPRGRRLPFGPVRGIVSYTRASTLALRLFIQVCNIATWPCMSSLVCRGS